MTKSQILAGVIREIIPRIQAEVDLLKARGNESASITRITQDLDLMLAICGGIDNGSFD